jgi:hypothetical protein
LITGTEQCDGVNLNGQSCTTFGWTSGSLSCNGSCQFVNISCQTCGDGLITGTEQCDGSSLNGASCAVNNIDACDGSTCQYSNASCYTMSIDTWFGTGVEGNVHYTSADSPVTLTQDRYINNLTLDDNVVINIAGFRIFVADTLTMGTAADIHRNGLAASGQTAGVALGTTTTLGGSSAGGAGGATNAAGSAGSGSTTTNIGGTGGHGGESSTVASSVPGGSVSASTGIKRIMRNFLAAYGADTFSDSLPLGGAGGGGGRGGTSHTGGGGGSGGGVVWLAAKNIVRAGGGAFMKALGGTGGSASGSTGGVGGGGGGGVIILIYHTMGGAGGALNAGTDFDVSGGVKGSTGTTTSATDGSSGETWVWQI